MAERVTLSPIKRVIQKKDTGKYYKAPHEWVDTIEEAKDFSSINDVVTEVGNDDLKKGCCILILRFDGKEFDVQLAI